MDGFKEFFKDYKVYVVDHHSKMSHYHILFLELGFCLVKTVEEADVVCFTGGADVSPEWYGHSKMKETMVDAARDEADLSVLLKCDSKFKVGICRGGQFLNCVANRGWMFQHVDNHAISGTHRLIDYETGVEWNVTSTHHQMMYPAPDAEVVAGACLSENKYHSAPNGNEFHIICDPTEEDVEVVWYDETMSLCFQPHPEFPNAKETREYFAECMARYLPPIDVLRGAY